MKIVSILTNRKRKSLFFIISFFQSLCYILTFVFYLSFFCFVYFHIRLLLEFDFGCCINYTTDHDKMASYDAIVKRNADNEYIVFIKKLLDVDGKIISFVDKYLE